LSEENVLLEDHKTGQAGPVRRLVRVCGFGFAALSVLMLGLLGLGYWHFQSSENSDFLRERTLAAILDIAGPKAEISLDRASLNFAGTQSIFSLRQLFVREPQAGLSISVGTVDVSMNSGSLLRMAPDPTALSIADIDLVFPALDQKLDSIGIAQALLGSLSSVAKTIAGVPNLERVDAERVKLARSDAQGQPIRIGEPFSLRARREGEQIRVEIARLLSKIVPQEPKAEPVRPLVLMVSVKRDGQGDKALAMRSEVGAIGALAALLGLPLSVVDPGLRFEAELDAGINADGRQGPVAIRFSLGGGLLDFEQYGVPALAIDEFSFALQGDPGTSTVRIPEFVFRSLETVIRGSGTLDIDRDQKRLRLEAQAPVIKPLSPTEKPVVFQSLALEASILRDLSTVIVDRVVVRDETGEAQAAARLSRLDGGLIETEVSVRDLDLRKGLRLWPVFISPELRDWAIERARRGIIRQLSLKSRLAGPDLHEAWAQKPIPDQSISAEYRLDQVEMAPVDGAPPVIGASILARGTGRSAVIQLGQGQIEALPGKPVSIAGAEFRVADVFRRPPVLEMRIPIVGSLEGVASALSAPGFRTNAAIPKEIVTGTGQVEGQIRASLRLTDKPAPDDLQVEALAELRNVGIPAIAPGERLEAGQFQLNAKDGQVRVKGDARLNGLPAQIEVSSEDNGSTIANIRATLDEAHRQKRGLDFKAWLTGPVQARLDIEFPKSGAQPNVDVTLDLSAAKVEGLVPGQLKRAGQAAKITFDFAKQGDRTVLDDLVVDLGGFSGQGRVELGRDGQPTKAEFATLKISPGDNARVSYERHRGISKLTVRGNSFDLRPFLKGVQSGRVDDSKAPDTDLDLQTTVLVGFGGELISSGEVQLQRRNNALSRLQVRGRFGGEALTVDTVETGGREGLTLRAATGDGGALLRFLDIYSKMRGGRLTADIRLSREGQSGLVQVRDFLVRGEPLLARYVSNSSAVRTPSATILPPTPRDSVLFTKLRADFSRTPGRIDLREAVMWGAQVGGTLEGFLDYGRDRVDLKGALVPAYALNNLFAQVPLFGPLFGGTQYEGLFALPFVIQGRASAPVLRTNALSVIAPGFLRKLFEVQRDGEASR
jgi:hypothetical protein